MKNKILISLSQINCSIYLFILSYIYIYIYLFNIFRANMALISSCVAQTIQISFHLFLIHLDWDNINNDIQSGPGKLAMEVRASVS